MRPRGWQWADRVPDTGLRYVAMAMRLWLGDCDSQPVMRWALVVYEPDPRGGLPCIRSVTEIAEGAPLMPIIPGHPTIETLREAVAGWDAQHGHVATLWRPDPRYLEGLQ